MKYIKIIFTVVVFSTSLLLGQVFKTDISKKGTTAASFLSISQGARATAMGSAAVGISGGDASALYYNPAAIAKIDGMSIAFDHTSWFADINYNYLAASFNFGSMGALGFSFTSSDVADMQVTTINEQQGTGEYFTVKDVAVSLAYAIQLTDNFSIGFNPKFIQQTIWKTSATGFGLDLGVQYVTPFDDIVLAMSITNFGTKMQLEGTSTTILYDYDEANTGNNDKIPANLATAEWALPLNFRVGLAYEPIQTENVNLLVAIDAMHPSDNYESVNVGGELRLYNFIALRGGYKSLFLDESEETFTFGIGLQQRFVGNLGINFDYGFQSFGRLENIQKFTVGLSF